MAGTGNAARGDGRLSTSFRLYFAYGSNMLPARLSARCPSAKVIGTGSIAGYTLDYSKRGRDGSGKATIVPAGPEDRVHGVLFRLLADDIALLDEFEGYRRGYDRLDAVPVEQAGADSTSKACTYIAEDASRDGELQPFDWYRALVIAGAIENGLPLPYVEGTLAVTAVADLNERRQTQIEALRLLNDGGHSRLLEPLSATHFAAAHLRG
jgi:gamma-glutamylcyclotransferase